VHTPVRVYTHLYLHVFWEVAAVRASGVMNLSDAREDVPLRINQGEWLRVCVCVRGGVW